jgi:hypothetical protein
MKTGHRQGRSEFDLRQIATGRLAATLLGLIEKHKRDPDSRTIAVTQQEISEMVGMSRESINKQLRAWAARSWVRLEHGAIVVLDAEALRGLAEAGQRKFETTCPVSSNSSQNLWGQGEQSEHKRPLVRR